MTRFLVTYDIHNGLEIEYTELADLIEESVR